MIINQANDDITTSSKENNKKYSDRITYYDFLILDYLNFSLANSKVVKELIITKAKSELKYQEIIELREYIKEKIPNYFWKQRFRIYELLAWIYNNITLKL